MKPRGVLLLLVCSMLGSMPFVGKATGQQGNAKVPNFSLKTATPSEECGACHVAIYREYAMGFGSDLKYPGMIYKSVEDKVLTLPANVSTGSTAHALSGLDPFPVHARGVEMASQSCNVCHFPLAFELPDLEHPEIGKPQPRPPDQESGGVTCASCHMTPDGKIRGPHGVFAPHATVVEPKIQSAVMCAYCHSLGKRVVGKQTQTFLEWRDDFYRPKLGTQHCQDCHMPRTLRKTAEDFDVPVRAVSRHLWTGGHSAQRVRSAASVVVVQPKGGQAELEFHVINLGAGHSVPTGSNRRGVYLTVDILDAKGKFSSGRDWLFAPSYGDRPDDRAFLAEDKNRPDAASATQADAQGPHEAPVRAGEERVLRWTPELKSGIYSVRAKLTFDLNRYNERSFAEDQVETNSAALSIIITGAP
jgi:hypothetical protein